MLKNLYWRLYASFHRDPHSHTTYKLTLALRDLLRVVARAAQADAVGIDMIPRAYWLFDSAALHAHLRRAGVHVEARGDEHDERLLLILWPDRTPQQVYAENDGHADIALEEAPMSQE